MALLAICLLAGSFIGYATTYSTLNNKINALQTQLQQYYQSNEQISNINTTPTPNNTDQQNQLADNSTPQTNDINTAVNSNDTVSLSILYQSVKNSVVIVEGLVPQYDRFGFLNGYGIKQGSGFVISVNGQQVIVTNNHVIESTINVTITFTDGSSHPATVLGADVYADLAILKVNSIPSGIPSLTLVSALTLDVGDTVVAVGSPYGLSGTLTTGIISAFGRTIREPIGNRIITIPDTIQTSTAINPGNSGGPLINLQGQVVGMTTATVSDSQSLGFAIPSDTIMREAASLVNTGKYTQHPSLNAVGRDMNLQIAQAMNINATYGWLVETAPENSGLKGGTSQTTIFNERIIIGGDIIIGAGNTVITNTDDLLSYLERNTVPGQNVEFKIIRNGQQTTVTVEVGSLA
ncbi:MAG: trypsin-like peptidase domain-containing protein [Candidatus Bathyarchaeota archaeon]|nr:trypsin-like peptidase domain-containing protein [Candidatus Termiticorpusculum sp.]